MEIIRKETALPLFAECDVLVVGGGPAGIGAAVRSAEAGARTMLLEKRGFLGGNITACYVENCNYFMTGHEFSKFGLYGELEKKSIEKFGNENVRQRSEKSFHSEYLKVFLDEYMKEKNVDVVLHSFVNEVIMDGGHIDYVVVQTKKGPQAVRAKVVVDCTGDADVAYAAGVPYDQGREKDGLCQPGSVTLRVTGADTEALRGHEERFKEIWAMFEKAYLNGETGLSCVRKDLPFGRLSEAGQLSYVNYACAYGIDPCDERDLSRGERECREYLVEITDYMRAHYPELRNIEISSMAPEIGFRDSRRIHGAYHLTIQDMESEKHFEDVIAKYPRFYDMLSPDANMYGDGSLEGKGYAGHIFEAVIDGRFFEIPYRSMVPVHVDNMLVAGRCIDSDHVAESGVRAISLCMITGEAAGSAAALCAKAGLPVIDAPVQQVQEIQKRNNVYIPD